MLRPRFTPYARGVVAFGSAVIVWDAFAVGTAWLMISVRGTRRETSPATADQVSVASGTRSPALDTAVAHW